MEVQLIKHSSTSVLRDNESQIITRGQEVRTKHDESWVYKTHHIAIWNSCTYKRLIKNVSRYKHIRGVRFKIFCCSERVDPVLFGYENKYMNQLHYSRETRTELYKRTETREIRLAEL